jgi:hypothetical protein
MSQMPPINISVHYFWPGLIYSKPIWNATLPYSTVCNRCSWEITQLKLYLPSMSVKTGAIKTTLVLNTRDMYRILTVWLTDRCVETHKRSYKRWRRILNAHTHTQDKNGTGGRVRYEIYCFTCCWAFEALAPGTVACWEDGDVPKKHQRGSPRDSALGWLVCVTVCVTVCVCVCVCVCVLGRSTTLQFTKPTLW